LNVGGKVTTTDVTIALKLIQKNIQINRESHSCMDIRSMSLDWGKSLPSSFQPPYDIVIASDCIYNTFYHLPLCETIYKLTDESSRVIIAYGHRGLHQENFFSAMISKGFAVMEKLTQTSDEQIVSLVILQKQPL